VQIRTATAQDIPAIMALYPDFFLVHEALQPQFFRSAQQDSSFLEKTVASENSDLLVAVKADEILGFALLQTRETPPFGCLVEYRYAYLLDLCVAPEYRRNGIGAALMAAAEQWTKERALAYLELDVLTNNERALGVYERSGFAPVRQCMRKML